MKIISVHSVTDSLQAGAATLSGFIKHDTLALHIETPNNHPIVFPVRLTGAVLTTLDSERSAGKAVAGAVAGALLLGPLGAVLGGAMGSSRKHTLVLKSPDARVVFEASTSELQELAGLGLPSTGDVPLLLQSVPKGKKKSHFFGYVCLALIVGMMVKCAVGKPDAETAKAAAAPQPSVAAATVATPGPAAAPPKKAPAKKKVAEPAKKPAKPEWLKQVKVAADTE